MKVSALILALFSCCITSAQAASSTELEAVAKPQLLVPGYSIGEYKSDILINGRVVMALQKAIERMREYRELTTIGRRVDSYEIGITVDEAKGVAEFMFLAKIDPQSKSIPNDFRAKGAVEMRIDVRLSDLKVLKRLLYN